MEGKEITRTTKVTNLDDAKFVVEKAKIRELELAAKAKALNGESLTAIMAGRKVSCEDAVAEWESWRENKAAANTVRTQAIIVRQWLRMIGARGWQVARLNADQIDAFVNPKDKTSRASRELRLASVRAFIGKFCAPRAYIVGDPSFGIKVRMRDMHHEQREARERQPVTEAEFKKLIAGTEGFWRQAIMLSYWCGFRLSDICCLEWASIADTSIIIYTRKTEARVQVPLSEPLIGGGDLGMTILEMMMEGKGRYCFPAERKIIIDPAQRAKLSVYATRQFIKCGVEGKSFHCLRHSFVTRLQKAGKTLEEIGRLVGHSNTKTTEGYAH